MKTEEKFFVDATKNRILIVDDEHVNIRILKTILSDDYDLTEASSGEEAIELAESQKFDLILLDIMMPGKDGYEVCRYLKTSKRHATIKTILVSARAMLEERLRGYECGADDYIVKPFDGDELLSKVKVFLRLKSMAEIEEIKGNLLKLIAHELRTPLNGLLGFAALLEKSKTISDGDKQYVMHILSCGNRLLEFSQKALLLCDLKSNYKITKKDRHLVKILEETIRSLQWKAVDKKIRFCVVNKMDKVAAFDPMMMNFAIRFVLDNAIKVSPQESEIAIHIEEKNDWCYIHIQDQGPGISNGQMDQIFQLFIVDDVMQHRNGQGLSLPITREIMRLHQGRLRICNNPSSGATVELSFPLVSE
ncbi:MAG: hybrid sensor histidine kinase/response regulator [Candidatus Omnitrophica bacterium]|nr:hybrid sensor histidine kinase/response regulator [Candidatus Omnitrophota bacterium]